MSKTTVASVNADLLALKADLFDPEEGLIHVVNRIAASVAEVNESLRSEIADLRGRIETLESQPRAQFRTPGQSETQPHQTTVPSGPRHKYPKPVRCSRKVWVVRDGKRIPTQVHTHEYRDEAQACTVGQ